MLKNTQHSQWIVCTSFVFILLLKNILFQHLLFGNLNITPTSTFLKFYGASFITALILCCTVFITKKHWWTIIVQILVDLWILSNIIYYRANGIYLNFDAITMADGLAGFGKSILAYLNIKLFIFAFLTLIFAIFILHLPKSDQRRFKIFFICLIIAYIYAPFRQFSVWKTGLIEIKTQNNHTGLSYHIHNYLPLFTPYNQIKNKAHVSVNNGSKISWEETYIQNNGIVDYFFAMLRFEYSYYNELKNNTLPLPTISNEEQAIISTCLQTSFEQNPKTNLILILVESFESWAIDYQGKDGYIMPNIHTLLQDSSIFYASKIKSQVKHGVSGDGQMIINTGLLPISSGAACRLYGDNIFPNIAHFFNNSVTLNPIPEAWNQTVINKSYGIKQLFENNSMNNDSTLMYFLQSTLSNIDTPFYIQAITISSHTPFDDINDSDIELDKDMPTIMQNYLKCMNYFDNCLGQFIHYFNNSPFKENTTIIITGDHTIFKPMMLKEFANYAQKHNMPIQNGQNYTPLIIYSPEFQNNTSYSEECYQMDIFPTILNTIGCEKYFWKGFGINLLNPTPRAINTNTAYNLSDKMIRLNYFRILD